MCDLDDDADDVGVGVGDALDDGVRLWVFDVVCVTEPDRVAESLAVTDDDAVTLDDVLTVDDTVVDEDNVDESVTEHDDVPVVDMVCVRERAAVTDTDSVVDAEATPLRDVDSVVDALLEIDREPGKDGESEALTDNEFSDRDIVPLGVDVRDPDGVVDVDLDPVPDCVSERDRLRDTVDEVVALLVTVTVAVPDRDTVTELLAVGVVEGVYMQL